MAKPEKVFKMGGVRASIFRNTITRNGEEVDLPKVVIEVRYRDKSGQWQGTNSLSLNDLPKAVTALQQAYEYLLGEGATRAPSTASGSDKDSASPASGSKGPRNYAPRVTTWNPGQSL